jgi:N-acetylglucosaminyl-diphospho-decaprenol L-rhamnosyltransferase
VLVLNSDAFVAPDTPARLAAALTADARLAACGAALVGEDGRRQKSAGRLLTLREALLRAVGVPGTPLPERGGVQEVEFVPLACVLLRREALDEVGGLDEGYRFYFEDYDLCWRLAAAGWTLAVRWDAGAVHVGGGSSSASDPAGWLPRFQASRIRYLRKRYGRQAAIFPPLWSANASAHAVLWLARGARARARGDRDEAARARRWAAAYVRSAAPDRLFPSAPRP